MNDYFAGTALESLASEGKIVKATRYNEMGFPPAPYDYLFQIRKTNKSARDEAKDIETDSACAVYQSFYQCPKEARYERKSYSKTIAPGHTMHGTQMKLKKLASTCERCWEKEDRERKFRLLVEGITRNDFVDTATREITGNNGEFQEAVIVE